MCRRIQTALLSNTRQERHLCYVWDGLQIATVYEKRGRGNDETTPRYE